VGTFERQENTMRASAEQLRDFTLDSIGGSAGLLTDVIEAGAERLSGEVERLSDLAPVVTIEVPKKSRHRLRYLLIATVVSVVVVLVVKQRAAAGPASDDRADG
jgi:hypothetical protein